MSSYHTRGVYGTVMSSLLELLCPNLFPLKLLSFAEVVNIAESTDFSEVSLGEHFFAKVF